jgi:hypothetical protein
MGKKGSRPGLIHRRIVDVMQRFPEGISGGQIRQELQAPCWPTASVARGWWRKRCCHNGGLKTKVPIHPVNYP